MGRAFGGAGANAPLFVALAALTSINATMIVGARTGYAMARDWPALRFMGGWHAERGTPVVAFLVQGVIALALVGFGALQHDGFEAMVEFTAPVFWTFLFLVGIALFHAVPRRRRRAAVPRAAVSDHADCVLRGLRMARVFQRDLRDEPQRGARLAHGDGGRRRRTSLDADQASRRRRRRWLTNADVKKPQGGTLRPGHVAAPTLGRACRRIRTADAPISSASVPGSGTPWPVQLAVEHDRRRVCPR